MAPISLPEFYDGDKVDIADLKAKVVAGTVEVEATPEPPVADNYMYDFSYNHPLPTTTVLGIDIPPDCNAQKEAEAIVSRLSEVMRDGNAQGFAGMFLEHGESQFEWVALYIADLK